MKWLPIHVIGAVLVSSCHHTPDAGENRNKTIVAEPKDSDKTRLSSTISDHDTTLILNYQAISCSCAQWGSAQDRDATDHVYLERDNADLTNADTLWRGDNIPLQIRVKGRYCLLYTSDAADE